MNQSSVLLLFEQSEGMNPQLSFSEANLGDFYLPNNDESQTNRKRVSKASERHSDFKEANQSLDVTVHYTIHDSWNHWESHTLLNKVD